MSAIFGTKIHKSCFPSNHLNQNSEKLPDKLFFLIFLYKIQISHREIYTKKNQGRLPTYFSRYSASRLFVSSELIQVTTTQLQPPQLRMIVKVAFIL